MKTDTIILAAGKGTRLNSELPKVLHPLAGKPLGWHIAQAVKEYTEVPPTFVVGYGAELVKTRLGDAFHYVLQAEQLGTAHAVQQAQASLQGQSDLILVLLGDMPLISGQTLQSLVDQQAQNTGPVSMLTVNNEQPRGFGRVLRTTSGEVLEIIEEVDCTPEQLNIHELNVSVYCFSAPWLWENLSKIPVSAKGEFYLTDIVKIASSQGLNVQATILDDPREAIGINSRVHLAEAESILQERINTRWMDAGVYIQDPRSTFIEPEVQIGKDTVIYANTHLRGSTSIGEHNTIGPNSLIENSKIGKHCKVLASVLENAELEDHVDIGPFGHLRKGAYLEEGVHMGNFGEVKNSRLGSGTKVGHFSYIGDTQTGKNVNIGAGTITCNYDGENKNKTIIEDGAFIGSDTMLIAPVKIGKDARTGAGSVVNKDVQEGEVVVGAPARAMRKHKKTSD